MGLPHPEQGPPGWGKVEKKEEEKQVEEKKDVQGLFVFFCVYFLV